MDSRITRLHIHGVYDTTGGLSIETQHLCISAEQAAEFLRQALAGSRFVRDIVIMHDDTLRLVYQGCTNPRAHQMVRGSGLHKFMVVEDRKGGESSELTLADYQKMAERWSQSPEPTPEDGRVGRLLRELLEALPPGHEVVIRRTAD